MVPIVVDRLQDHDHVQDLLLLVIAAGLAAAAGILIVLTSL